MARLWSSGFELNSTAAGKELYIGTSGGGAVSISSTTFRSGAYALRCLNTGANGSACGIFNYTTSSVVGPLFARTYFRVANLPAAQSTIFRLDQDVSVELRLNTDGTLELWDIGGQIGSDSSALSLDTWYRLEIKAYHNTTTNRLESEARINGVSFASTSTGYDTSAEGDTAGFTDISFGDRSAVTSYDYFFDDVAINDSTGSFQNSWPGDGKIIHLRPNAAGDASDWTNSYTDVDEVTPDDDTTTCASSTLDAIDDYNIDASGLTSETINVVSVGVRLKGSSTSNNSSFVVRVKAAAAGTVQESSAITPPDTAYYTNYTDVDMAQLYPLTMYDLPGASTTAWAPADLDNAQIGVRVSAAAANAAVITAMWMLVDYSEAAATTSTSSTSVSTSSTSTSTSTSISTSSTSQSTSSSISSSSTSTSTTVSMTTSTSSTSSSISTSSTSQSTSTSRSTSTSSTSSSTSQSTSTSSTSQSTSTSLSSSTSSTSSSTSLSFSTSSTSRSTSTSSTSISTSSTSISTSTSTTILDVRFSPRVSIYRVARPLTRIRWRLS